MSRKYSQCDILKTEGNNLSEAIKALGMKRNAFAASLRLSHSLISEICNGKKGIQEYMLLLIEKIHYINPEYIKGNSEIMLLSELDNNSSPTLKKKQPIQQKQEASNQSKIICLLEKQIISLENDKRELRADKERLLIREKELYEEVISLKRELESPEKEQNTA